MAQSNKNIKELRKSMSEASTPMLAAMGATDVAAEKVREATAKMREMDPKEVREELAAALKQLQQALLDLTNRAQDQFDELATRGDKLIKRMRDQQSSKDLKKQMDTTVAAGKGAVTTIRRAAVDIEHTVEDAANKLAQAAETQADAAAAGVKTAVDRSRSATKRTTTSARKTATQARKAASDASKKVGD